jgi:hypothetical protein
VCAYTRNVSCARVAPLAKRGTVVRMCNRCVTAGARLAFVYSGVNGALPLAPHGPGAGWFRREEGPHNG